jgi:hypothetical protein
MEQYNAQRTDVMERALILLCMSGDVRNYLAQYEKLRMASYTENEEEQKGALLSYDRWDTNRKEERQTCLNWDERIADALRKEFGLVQLGDESCKEPRKEFGRRGASDHSTHCDALMRFCNALNLKVTGFAVDVASIKDLSEEEAKQLYDWMAKGLAKPNGNGNGIKKNCPGKQSPRQGINGAWWSAWRGDQGVMSLGEGHGDQWSLVECLERRPRGHVTVERDMGIT